MNYHFEKRGKEIERELLGTIKNTHESEEEQEKIDSYIKRRLVSTTEQAATIYIKEMQASHPELPDRPFARLVRYQLVSLFEDDLGPDDRLRYYTSLTENPRRQSMLDSFGIDCFFELTKNGIQLEVSVDINNGKTKDSPNAAVIQYIPDDFPVQARLDEKKPFAITGVTPDEEKIFNNYVTELAEQVAAKFRDLIRINFPEPAVNAK